MGRILNRTAVALLATSMAFGPTLAMAQEQSGAAAGQPLPSIVVTEASVRHLVESVIATGTIQAVDEVFVQPLVEGLSIKSLEVDEGDRVEADAVVARLNDDTLLLQKSQLEANKAKAEAALAQYEAQLADARVNAAEAERQYRRASELGKSGTVSQSSIEQAETAASSAAAKVTTAEKAIAIAEADIKVVESQIADIDLKLARTDVKSPVAGVVANRSAKIGAIASGAGQPLFTIYRDGQVELVADVSETQILKVKAGQKATIRLSGGAVELSGHVRRVAPTVDPVTRLGSVHISIDDDESARSGMYATAAIIVSEADGVALPLSAITTTPGGASTRVVSDGVVRQVDIQTGIQDGAFLQVTSGLNAGDLVVAKAGAFVRDGDRITPVRDSAAMSN